MKSSSMYGSTAGQGRRVRGYTQIFSENMGKMSEPEITVCLKGVNWTRITFKPDLAKFHMTHLDDDIIALMMRVVDMAGFLGTSEQVVFNGRILRRLQDGFSNYVLAYIRGATKDRNEGLESIGHRVNDQLEVCVSRSDGNFEQVSYVNKFATTEGGTHVDFVSNQIAARLVEFCSKNFKVEEHEVKRHLWVFVNAVVENPTFDSPTRDALTTPQESFGPSFELPDGFLRFVYQIIVGKLLPLKTSSKDKKASKKRC